MDDKNVKPKIDKFLNLADNSIYTDTNVPVDEPLFEPIPPVIQFTDYEPLQLKQKLFKLRNKDKVTRRVKILQPDSRLFQVIPALNPNSRPKPNKNGTQQENIEDELSVYQGNKVSPGMEACYYIRFSPEAKIDYNYDLRVVTEREQFIVPLVAVGKRAMIDFPDILDFSTCPVKYITEKPVIIRNLGEKTTKWFLKFPKGFDADKKEGVLENGKNEQIVIQFFPHEAMTYKSEAILAYDNLEAYIPIMGIARDSNVYLSKSHIQMDDAYIGLQTQQTLQIINKSEVKVNFEWRAFATEKEEQEKKNRLRQQLEEEEVEERMLLKEIVNNEAIHEEFEFEDHEDSDEEDKDEKAILLKRQKKAELMLARKYKNIRKAIEDDLLLFQDDIFSIEPQQGQIWPNSEMTITITFVPKGALHYSCVSYCNISCSEARLALNLAGEGIGPKAFLSQHELPIGNKNVNEKAEFDMKIENRGEIRCKFELLPNERNFGKMFKFDQTRGTLEVGESKKINIQFCSTIPGEFKETFRWRLEGSTELLSLTCFGHVTAPRFRFSPDRIDFGSVSYSFTREKEIFLINESNVSFTYSLRIPGDGKLTQKEFEIEPARDVINKGEEKSIIVRFQPHSTKKYEMVMVVDIEGVGQDMYSLPIKAESLVPTCEIKCQGGSHDTLDFGNIYLRDPDTRGITLINNSDLHAKFQVSPQNVESKVLATYRVDQESGFIEPNSSVTIRVTLMTMKLREITLPISISIVGANNGQPFVINIVANSVGPRVEVCDNLKELDFKDVQVLQDYTMKVMIKNDSPIVADFHAFTKNKNSIFKPIEKKGVLQPSEIKEIQVICCADDSTKFQDVLHFVIKEGVDLDVVLKARGIGTTIYCKEDLNNINFDVQYTHRTITREIFVENKGRKDQKLQWVRKKATDKKALKDDQSKKLGGVDQPQEEPDIFQIIPDQIVLPQKHGIMFQIKAISTKKGKIPEIFQLNCSSVQERKTSTLYTTTVEGEFIQPTLLFSERKLYFKYVWEKGVPFMLISKELELTCGSQLPVNFTLKTQKPFSISADQFALLPGKSGLLRVDYDPEQKTDRVSGQQPGKIQIIHNDHPHREFVELVGEVCFPNIQLETNMVNFGSILNDTSKKIHVNMKNVSEMPIYYEWTFVEEELVQHSLNEADKNSSDSRNSIREPKTVPINEVFDILPLSGYLNVGESEQVEFVYNAFGGQRFKTTAVCHVEGGPNYEVTLIGDSSLITYRLSTNNLELGEVRFCDWITKEFTIENTGKVTFEYRILHHQIKRKGYTECSPSIGRIAGGEKQKISVKVCPLMPNEFKEIIMVQVGYFEPEPITITGKGVYPSILMNIPRQEDLEFTKQLETEFEKKKQERENTLKRQQLMAKAQEGNQGSGKGGQSGVGAGVKSLETIQNDIEKELDRQKYCSLIQSALVDRERERLLQSSGDLVVQDQREILPEVNQMNKTGASMKQGGTETKIYEKIFLSNYICDFGNVVINNLRKKQFKIMNVGASPIDFFFDQKFYRNAGYQIVPERITKLMPGDEATINVSYLAKKNMKFGKSKTLVPLEIKNGAKYQIELLANITIPEVVMENIQENVDFGKVLCGQRKTFFVRLVNEKEIDCEWTLNTRDAMIDKKKEPCRFLMEPTQGTILSGQKQVIKISFQPAFEKEYQHKFVLNIDQNPKAFYIPCLGQGASINLQFEPSNVQIGPVLPYDKFAYAVLQVKNPTEYETLLYSLDFDEQYKQDEQYLHEYEGISQEIPQAYFEVRKPGQELWVQLKKEVEKKRKREALQKEIDIEGTTEERKEQLQREINQLSVVEKIQEYPAKVEDSVKHHLILVGPPGCGKTGLLEHLNKVHKRARINLAEVIQWAIENKTAGGKLAQQQLDEKKQERDKIEQDRENLKKKAGKKAAELDEKWGEINEQQFLYLSEEVFEKCLAERIQHPDCNAGVMIDGLESVHYPNAFFGLKYLLKVFAHQSVELIEIKPILDANNLEVWKIIEHEGMEVKEEKVEETVQEDDKKKKPKKEHGGQGKKVVQVQEKEKAVAKVPETKKSGGETQKSAAGNVQGQKKKDQQGEKVSLPSGRQDELQEQQQQEVVLFDVFHPRKWQSQDEKNAYELTLQSLVRQVQNKFTEKLQIPAIYDKVFEEGKKEEKKVVAAPVKKGGKEVVVEEVVVEKESEVVDYSELHKAPRKYSTLDLHYNLSQLHKTAENKIPAPIYPDPNTLPVQEPLYHQVVVRPEVRKIADQNSSVKNFKIWTPRENKLVPLPVQKKELHHHHAAKEQEKDQKEQKEEKEKEKEKVENKFDEALESNALGGGGEQVSPGKGEEEEHQKKKKVKSLKRKEGKKEEESQEENKVVYHFEESQLDANQFRWTLPPHTTLLLVVQFQTKVVGNFSAKLDFESFFSLKKYQVDLSGVADFPQVSSLPKNIYWSVKKQRPTQPPESYLSKVYVSQEGTFDFGPLLIGKNPEKKTEPEIKKVNSCTFRIYNPGKFDTQASFALLSSVMENNPSYKKGVFILENDNLTIPKNDVPQEIRVWAIPDEDKLFKDEIIVMIKDNPMPVQIPLQCQGCVPDVQIVEGQTVVFHRLLINQTGKKQVLIKNRGQIPVKWKLNGVENLPEQEFQLQNTSGELKPTEEAIIEVNFKAIMEKKYKENVTLEVQDVEGLNIKQADQKINIEAEAFNINLDLKFPDGNQDNMLTFGAVRVGDVKDQVFTVKNIGLYQVKLSFVMKKKLFKDSFKIEPGKLDLEPNQEKQILVRFCSDKEVKLKTTREKTDITMEILEGNTGELFKPVPINVEVNSVFSKYSIVPIKNMNFGPVQFNESKTLNIEIKNEGLFEFSFNIFDYFNEEFRKQLKEEQEAEAKAKLEAALAFSSEADKDKKKGKKDDKKEAKKGGAAGGAKKAGKGGKEQDPDTMLRVGQWAINPAYGSVSAQSSQQVEITFSGQGMKLFEQKLAIDVTGRDPGDQPQGILYETVAESCVPGIVCDQFEQIFEEQIIMASQHSSSNITSQIQSNVFYYEEKCFNFGTLVPSKNPDGICEKFKIINPNKIPCTVKFDVRKKNPASTENFAFECATKSVKIHPHESVYVKVYFKPTIMAQYAGLFEAVVEQGELNPRTQKLVFDLRGEGAMPTVKLEKPSEWVNENTPILKFPKTRVDKAVQLPVVVKNDGQVPATLKWDLTANENFRFLDQNSISLTPKTYGTFGIEFKPKDVGVKQWWISVQTLLNPYEVTKLLVQGEGFYEDIVFQGLPKDLEDEVNLGDCIIGQEKKISFQIKNNSSESVKFKWNTQGIDDFVLVPRTGHLAGKSVKQVSLVFRSMKSVSHKNFVLSLETQQIKQLGNEFITWDDSMYNLRYVTQTEFTWWQKKKEEEEAKRKEEEQAGSNKKGAKKADKKPGKTEAVQSEKPPQGDPSEDANIPLQEPIPEPDHNSLDKTEKQVNLKVSCVADFARYEVETREIFFKPTRMYESRTHTFYVKNTSLITIKYQCKIIMYENNKPVVDPGYFYITPKMGTLAPNCDENFTVKFTPTEVQSQNERYLIVTIENLEPKSEPLVIELDGEAERPICHFELPNSNYREKKPDIDSSFSIVEFESLGTKVKNTKRFYVVNPTSQGYEFEWKKIDEDKLPPTANAANEGFFKCATQKGICLSGKKFEMVFEYNPDIVGTHEAYYQFVVPEHKITQNFLFVGHVKEPNVFYDVGKVNFGPLLIGGKNKEVVVLKNLEDVPISFSYDKNSIKGDQETGTSLIIFPLSGTIRPNSEQAIEITFQPQIEQQYNFNILCQVQRKSRPISLNIKGIGYILDHSIYYQELQQGALDQKQSHNINFGDIYINEKRTRFIEIENKGEFNFDFTWKKQPASSFLQIVPEHGTVKQHEKFRVELKFIPIADFKFQKGSVAFLSITSGPTYTFNLFGSARKPGVELSFSLYNFGPCYVLKQPHSVTHYLEMRNRDNNAISIDTLFEKKPYLDVQLASGTVIMPLQLETIKDKKGIIQTKELNVLRIPIVFTPRECIKYSETITFDINGLHKIDVQIQGEGAPFKLELVKTEDQNVQFGVVKVFKENTRVVQVQNLSKIPVTINFNSIEDQAEDLKKNYISIQPSGDLLINPREKKDLEFTFAPKVRMHQFKKEIFYRIQENQEIKKLLNVFGTCHGIELKLMEDTIGFGVVTVNSKKVKTVQLSNLGDIGAKFEWNTLFCKRYFTISPEKGYLPPNEDTNFTITFHPDVIDSDIQFNKVKCEILGSEPLFINLLGRSVSHPKEAIQEIKFETVVRTEKKIKVSIKNPTPESTKIRASIQSNLPQFKEYFSGKEYLEIAPNSQAEYEISYLPLTMTLHNELMPNSVKNHEATLFFPMPDGSALLYNLSGVANPPQAEQTFDQTIKAKINSIVTIPIKNWLKTQQRFKVTWKQDVEEPSIFITGANTFDVSGDSSKDYKLSLYGLKQSQSKISLYFTNDVSQEFKFFRINLNVSAPDQQQKIELQAFVRETISKVINIENPMKVPVEIKKEFLSVDNENISFNPPSFTIPAHSEFGFEIVYRPLLVKDEAAKVTLKSPELGEYVFPLALKGLPASTISRTMQFKASFGSEIIQSFKFTNYCKKQTQYQCRVEKLGPGGKPIQSGPVDPKAKVPVQQVDFTIDQPVITAPPADSQEGNEITVNIKYEPSSLGETQCVLIVQSNEGGEYQAILNGQSIAPQPKGPFKIGGAKSNPIEFKNPFFDAKEFIIRIDNPNFTTATKNPVKIDGKKVLGIALTYKPAPGTSNNGRLIIQLDKTDYPPWVVYIQGE